MNNFCIPFGPQHPGLVEPIHVKLEVEGENVVGYDIKFGYSHRGIEKALENRHWIKGIFLAERVCGICSHCHTLAITQGIETLAEIKPTERSEYIRVVMAELERLHSHMLTLGVCFYEIGFQTVFQYMFRDREIPMELLELISGNRVNYGMNIPGGVRRDIEPHKSKAILQKLSKLESRFDYYIKLLEKDTLVKKRTQNVGILSKKDAIHLGATGPVRRASGISTDFRKTGYGAYGNLSFYAVIEKGCDVHSRLMVRTKECIASIRLIREALRNMPDGEINRKMPPMMNIEKGRETLSRVEAQRGELIYYLRSDGMMPYRIKIKTPTYANYLPLGEMLKGSVISDVPITVASLDPCITCADRVTVVKDGKESIVSKDDLKKM
ncbi:MAG: nickel-dependent hydrogenase large subunit [Candidatus Aenigmarchaeota archaeon]|nr:nickel-dependent hydrogenase large subunit [Candidatus Aenigmarchaeota archaeon]